MRFERTPWHEFFERWKEREWVKVHTTNVKDKERPEDSGIKVDAFSGRFHCGLRQEIWYGTCTNFYRYRAWKESVKGRLSAQSVGISTTLMLPCHNNWRGEWGSSRASLDIACRPAQSYGISVSRCSSWPTFSVNERTRGSSAEFDFD